MKTVHFFNAIFTILILTHLTSCSDDDSGTDGILAPTEVQAFDVDNDNSSTDIRIFFTNENTGNGVSSFRVYISKSSKSLTADQAIALNSDQYQEYKGADETARFNITSVINDTDGDAVTNGRQYKAYVLAVPSDNNATAQLSESSSNFKMTNKDLKDFYVSSNATHSVELFDGVTGEHIKSFVTAKSGGLLKTQEVIFMEDGSLLVTGLGARALKRYDGNTGEFIGDFTTGYTLSSPTKTKIGPDGHLYVSQFTTNKDNNAVVRFNLETGVFIDEVVPSLSQGMGQAWDSEGNLYVVSWGLGLLQKYSPTFELIDQTTSNLSGPVNIWIDDADVLHVIDWTEGNVKRFDTDLEYQDTFITGMTNAEGYLFDNNLVYICDWKSSKVEAFNLSTGEYVKTIISSPEIREANGITFGPDHRPE